MLLLLSALTGCAERPLKGGRALMAPKPGGGVEQSLSQGENPSQSSAQEQESLRVRTYTVPAGSCLRTGPAFPPAEQAPRSPAPPASRNPQSSILNPQVSEIVLSAPMPVAEREESRASSRLGAAQKDMAREWGAKLSSLRGIVWVGLGLFLFGLGTIFYAPLRALIGSLTTSLAITLGGLALMVLPTLIVGNELLLLGGVGLAVGGWCLAHRHGELSGQVKALAAPQAAASEQPKQ